jgi:hypothetical protein
MRGLWAAGIALVVAGCGTTTGPALSKTFGTASPRPASTFARTCPPAGDASPRLRVTLPARAGQIGKTVLADIDGDGRVHSVRLMSGWRDEWGGGVDELTVRFASGRGAFVQIPDDEMPGNRILGVADINADGRYEVIVWAGGNTAYGADAVTLVGDRLMVATRCEFDVDDGWYRESPLSFFAQSNSCRPWCDLTTACRVVDGAPRLVLVEGSSTASRRRWTVTLYRLAGADFERTATYRGSVRRTSPLPARWPFLNALSCGTARFPDG